MIKLRKPTSEDAEELARLVDELNVHEGDPTGHFTAEKALADVIAEDAPVSALIAEDERGAVGYAIWCFSYETAWAARGSYLADLYVRDRARKMGVGDALLRGVARATRDAGGSFFWWTAYRTNDRARAFYRNRVGIEDDVVAYAAAHEAFEALLR